MEAADRRASTDAMSTSPAATPLGRGTVSVGPAVVAVATAPPDGKMLTARPDPVAATLTATTSARSIRW
jgi:hypothetical protein